MSYRSIQIHHTYKICIGFLTRLLATISIVCIGNVMMLLKRELLRTNIHTYPTIVDSILSVCYILYDGTSSM